MRNLKRVLSLALALVMVLGMMVITTSAADYTDAEEITYTEAVEVMSAIGILAGNPDGSFAPQGTLTREQAAKILAFVCLGADADDYLTGSAAPFEDVAADKWSAKYIAFCKNAKIINGVNAEQTLFNPAGTLTTVQFTKMLLCALGIEGTYTGEGWEANVKADAKDNDLDVVTIDRTDITREEACAMALAALKAAPAAGLYWTVTQGTAEYTFETQNDALLYKHLLGAGAVVDGPFIDRTTSLLATVHKVSVDESATDAYGRPAVSYNKTTWDAPMMFVDEPVLTYTSAVKGGTIYTDLGKPATAIVSYVKDGKSTGSFAMPAGFAIASGNAVTVGDTGFQTEVYKTGLGTYTIVVEGVYLDKVATHNDATKDANGDIVVPENITLTNAGSVNLSNVFYTAEYAEADEGKTVVCYKRAWNADNANWDITAVENATSITGKLSAYNTTANKYTIGGTVYAKNASFVADITGNVGAETVYYLDANGNLIGSDAVRTITNHAVLTQLVKVTPTPDGSIGSTAENYLQAELVMFDGTSTIVTVDSLAWGDTIYGVGSSTKLAYTYDNGTTWTDLTSETTFDGRFVQKVVEYEVNNRGEYVLTGVAQSVAAAGADLVNTAVFADTSADYANNVTKFVVRTGSGSPIDPYKYTLYTGFNSLPTKLFTANSVTVTGVENRDGVAECVYITGTVASTAADRTVAYVTGSGTYNFVVNAAKSYYEYPVIINGQVTTIKVAGTASQPVVGLYNITAVNAETGYVTTMSSASTATITAAAKEGVIVLSTGAKTYDGDETVYVIDASDNTVETAAITSLTTSYTGVYVTYEKDIFNADTNNIDTIIAIKP